MEVREVDGHDDAALRACHELMTVSTAHDRTRPDLTTYDELAVAVRRPGPYEHTVVLAARDQRHGDRPIGVAVVWYALQDNLHLVDLELQVLPDLRRQGIGTALHRAVDARRRALGRPVSRSEVYAQGRTRSAGLAFAVALGYHEALVEDHLVLDLPVPDARVAALEADPPASDGAVAAYEVLAWAGRCPDDLLADLCDLRTRMDLDVPTGELDIEPVAWDEARLRTRELRAGLVHDSLVVVARRRDGSGLAGYSELAVPHGGRQALQEDTLVMPSDRGHRLGTTLKLANLRRLADLHPEVTEVHTWTEPDNAAMWRTNSRFGFGVVDQLHEMERHDD